jgi:transposase
MGDVITIGLDIAKSVFHIHGVNVDGAVVIRKRVSRAKVLEFFAAVPRCLVGIEACPSAHYWSRELEVLRHTVKLMPLSYVKAYLKRSKNDANDAAAICEAVTRPSMRLVSTKSEQQQSGLMLRGSLAQLAAVQVSRRKDAKKEWKSYECAGGARCRYPDAD